MLCIFSVLGTISRLIVHGVIHSASFSSLQVRKQTQRGEGEGDRNHSYKHFEHHPEHDSP